MRVRKAREALSGLSVREEASETLKSLIETITIQTGGSRTYADIVGSPEGLWILHTKNRAPRGGGGEFYRAGCGGWI